MHRLFLSVVLLSLGACASAPRVDGSTAGGRDTAAACFSVASLSEVDRRVADRVLLAFGDREGLYTLAGGLKPISSDVGDVMLRVAPTVDSAALSELAQLRRVAAALQCGEIGTFVQVFTAPQVRRDSSVVRATSLVMYHRASLRRAIARQQPFFATLGLTPEADAREILAAVENAPRDARWRGYGYLFGYPDDAVDFFVRAGVVGDSSKTLVPRDFRRVDTWLRFPEGANGPRVLSSFVYAVPKGAGESEGDRALRSAAAPIYAEYVRRRAIGIQADSSGAIALWRAWLSAPLSAPSP